MKHKSVINCAVVALKDKNNGNAVKAFIKIQDRYLQENMEYEV